MMDGLREAIKGRVIVLDTSAIYPRESDDSGFRSLYQGINHLIDLQEETIQERMSAMADLEFLISNERVIVIREVHDEIMAAHNFFSKTIASFDKKIKESKSGFPESVPRNLKRLVEYNERIDNLIENLSEPEFRIGFFNDSLGFYS